MPTSSALFLAAEWSKERKNPEAASRAVREYLATLDDAAFGAASEVMRKFVSPSDPAAQWTGAMRGPAFFAYADNYLVDVKFGMIMDVEASRAIRQAEVGATKTMIERTEARFDIKPKRLAADTAYGRQSTSTGGSTTKRSLPIFPSLRSPSALTAPSVARGIHVRQGPRGEQLPREANFFTTTGKIVNDRRPSTKRACACRRRSTPNCRKRRTSRSSAGSGASTSAAAATASRRAT